MNIITENSDLNCHICPFCKKTLFNRWQRCFSCGREIKYPRYLLDLIISKEDRVNKIDDLLGQYFFWEWQDEFLKDMREKSIFSAKQINLLNSLHERKTGEPFIDLDDFP